ncbi:MAG TPA: hypothetical protein VF267_02700 [Gammaproteobacteria bacterium]
MIRRLNSLYAVLPLTLFMVACTTDSDESVTPATDATPTFVAVFKPDLALMPFPTDVWRNGSTDGTLNIYAGNPQFESDPLVGQVDQLNLLDGFGLNSPILADFSDPLDDTSIDLGTTVFVFNVTNPLAPVPVASFDAGTAGFQGGRSVVALDPTEPLAPLNTYAVFLTKGIMSADGTAASADASFQAMIDAYNGDGADDLEDGSTEEAIYAAMVENLLTLADAVQIGADNVVAAWAFTTQSKGASLATIKAGAAAQSSAFVPLLKNPANPAEGIYTAGELLLPDSDTTGDDGVPDTGMNADVYAGVIEMPYYSDPANPLTGYWEADADAAACQGSLNNDALPVLLTEVPESTTAFCAAPELKATIAVPVLLTVPNTHAANAACGVDANGLTNITGITIFQHGITQARTNILPIAGALAQSCHATIAIDLPLHGVTDTTSQLYASAENPLYAALEDIVPGITDALTEQTFDLDVDDAEGIDPSGEYFINLESPITARDALRQAAANLIHLTATIPEIDYNVALAGLNPAFAGADFALAPIRFVGHSLGGITGATYLGVDDTADAAVLIAPGGDIGELILNSASIYPEVEEGLAENGLVPGMRFFDEFFRNAQTLVDAGDPINYAVAANASHNILMMEVVGGAGNNPDQVVPNSATQDLADAMGLEVVTTTVIDNAAGVDGLVRFSAGDHGSILSPAASLETTTEMQTEMAVFIGGHPLLPALPGGHAILITDSSVIAP